MFALEVEAGDLIRAARHASLVRPCGDRRIRAIRLFGRSGWTPHYTESASSEAQPPVSTVVPSARSSDARPVTASVTPPRARPTAARWHRPSARSARRRGHHDAGVADHDVLFPYARRHLRDYLESRVSGGGLDDAARMLAVEWADVAGGEPVPPVRPAPDDLASVADYLSWLMIAIAIARAEADSGRDLGARISHGELRVRYFRRAASVRNVDSSRRRDRHLFIAGARATPAVRAQHRGRPHGPLFDTGSAESARSYSYRKRWVCSADVALSPMSTPSRGGGARAPSMCARRQRGRVVTGGARRPFVR